MPPPPVDGGPAGTAGGVVVCGDGAGVLVCGDAAASGGFVVVCGDAGGVVCGDAGGVVCGEPGGDVPAGLVPADAVGLAGPLVVGEVVHAETETETTTVKVAQAAK